MVTANKARVARRRVSRPTQESWTKHFSFRGRLGRLGYFYRVLIICVGFLASGLMFGLAIHSDGPAALTVLLIAGIVLLVTAVFGWSITVRRAHDFGYSGWHVLAVYVAQLIVQSIAPSPIIPILLSLFLGAVMLLHPGETCDNKYGEAAVAEVEVEDEEQG